MPTEFREALFNAEQREIREKLQQQWRMACPAAHTQFELQKVPSVYCYECNSAYAYEELVERY